MLAEDGKSLGQLGHRLSRAVPSCISVPLNPSGTVELQDAALRDVVDKLTRVRRASFGQLLRQVSVSTSSSGLAAVIRHISERSKESAAVERSRERAAGAAREAVREGSATRA